MGKAQASIEITSSSSRLAAGLNQARQKFQAFAGSVARGMGAAFKSINAKLQPGQTMKNAGAHMMGDLGSKGVGAILDAATAVRDYERDLTRVRISAGQSAQWQEQLNKSLRATSVATGVNSGELAQAASTYFDLTSDAKGMTQALDSFGRVALASGANMDDIVRAAAAMQDSMGLGAGEMESAFSGLIQQGKAGKISLKDMGKEFPSLLAMFSKFGKGRSGMMEMGAAYQVGAKAFGSASQSATGLEAMMGMLQARQAQLKKEGVDVFQVNKDGSVTLRGLHDIVTQIADKKIDPRKWGKVFGENKEGRNFLEMLIKMPKLYDEVVAAGADAGAVQRDAFAMAESDAGRLDLAINRVKEAIATAFTPDRIHGFVNAVEGLVEKLGPLVDAMGKAGDILGGIVGVGKNIRGAIGGNGGRSFLETAADETMVENKQSNLDFMRGTKPFTDQQVAGAKSRLADDKARKAAQEAILAGETGERTSKESIRRAVLAANSGKAYGQGNIGESMAGEQYLRAAGVSPEDRAKLEQQILADAVPKAIKDGFLSILPSLVASTKPELKVGDNAIAASAAAATKPRRGVR